MIAKIKTRVDFGGIVNYANDQKNKKKCATLSGAWMLEGKKNRQ